MRNMLRGILLSSGAAAALLALSGAANAGGFAVREQSTEFQGMSFAGAAASGGGLSGMFWNPAIAAYAPVGIYTESHYAGIFGDVSMTAQTGTSASLLALGAESDNIAKMAVVPSSYMSYRLSDKLVAALSINSPFGLVTEPSNRIWAGQTAARTSDIKTYNFAPTLAYQLMPTLAIGVGLQIQRIEGRLKNAAGVTAPNQDVNTNIKGDDLALGFTAGVNWAPTASTSIGLGYRSSINHNLHGTISNVPAGAAGFQGAAIQAGINLPEIVTLSLRQAVSERVTVLATAEWSNWSRVEKLDVVCADNPAPNVLCPTNGRTITSLHLGWKDGWMTALGGEFKYSDNLLLRTGVAYEKSPVQSAEARTQRVPDMDRFWTSLGATYKWSEKMTFDFAYTHIFGIGDNDIDRVDGAGRRFIGTVDSQVDIVSASMKIKLGHVPAAHEPMK